MGKNIWMFHHYATPPTMSGLTRPYFFGKYLKRKGYDCKIFSSAYLHYTKENLIIDNSRYKIHIENEIPFIFVRSSEYNDNGFLVWQICFLLHIIFYRLLKFLQKRKSECNICFFSSSLNYGCWNYDS